ERNGDAERLDRLRRRIRPVMLRRSKGAVASDLPEKQERVLEVDLEPRHRRMYQVHLARERQKVLGLLGDIAGNRFEILRSLTVLRQAALDVSLVDTGRRGVPATKLDVLAELLGDAVVDGHRVLVFSQFTRFLAKARQRVEAAGIPCCYLDGSTRRRADVIERFRQGEAPVFLISLKAGGIGLNLTEADHCILLDPWWNPATEAQAVDRVHRIGQTRKVMVHRLVARDTIEEKVMALKERKAKLFASVVDAGGFESAALTAADIRELLG
ncbi:MAG TPA: DEAD/DEAH box helicase, partial [Acidimicrobiales bacterium]|nr:DEAD/DEAH box helicase [Acidimicrobiales bacterium]